MEATQKIDINPLWLEKLQSDFSSARVTDEDMCRALSETHSKYNYFIDPHTAIAVAGAEKMGYNVFETDSSSKDLGVPYAILSTASPCKFEESVTVAMGKEGWKAYVDSQFPEKASEVILKDEINPTIYEWSNSQGSLEEVQSIWELKARKLIMEKFVSEVP